MISRIPFDRVNWSNSIFLFVITLIAIFGAPLYLWKYGMDPFQLSMFVFYVLATGMSITLGYHRLFAHLSFRAKWPVKLFTLVFGACAFENSALKWVSDHRTHHKHVDEDDDPYDISKGFFWAHMGWILFKTEPLPPLENVNDLKKDKLIMWQYKWDKILALAVGLFLPALLGFIWNGPIGALGGFLIAGVLRVFVVQQSTFFINSLCHCIGRQPYSTNCSARDSFIMSLFTFGEGYHNYHHEFQHDYRNGVKPWNFDPTKWAIWFLEKAGLAENLRRVPKSRILLSEMVAAKLSAEKELEKIAEWKHLDSAWKESAIEAIHNLLERLHEIREELEEAISEKAKFSRKCIVNRRKELLSVLRELAEIRSTRLSRFAAA